MSFFKRIWSLKQTKITLAVLLIAGILAAAFFFAPGSGKNSAADLEASSGRPEQSSTAGTAHLQAPSETAGASGSSENTISAAGTAGASGSAENTSFAKETSKATNSTKQPENSAASAPPKDEATPPKDKYQTDPVPDGKPQPQEPEDTTVDASKKHSCIISIRCDSILNNMDSLKEGKEWIIPKDGVILADTTVTFSEGESVFDVLQRITREKKIHMEFRNTPMYNSAYIEGINNLYEFDGGPLSGWMYKVNDWFPNYGCSRYAVKDGDKIEWVYTCDLGADVGGGYITGQE